MRIAVLMGGVSTEREISIKTGEAILKSLQNMDYDAFAIVLDKEHMIQDLHNNQFDAAFIALHGEYGEDGRVQAVLDIMDIPYTGSNYSSSAIAMNKIITKDLLSTLDGAVKIPKTYYDINEIFRFPVIVKPIIGGSSINLTKCNNKDEVKRALAETDDKMMIEECIVGEEVTVGVLNGEPLGVVKIKPKEGLYDYKAKYTKGETEFEVPANIDGELYDSLMKSSKLINEKLDLDGGVRVDYIINRGKTYFLEVNTIPGMTELSLLPKTASIKGLVFDEIVKKMLEKFAKIQKK